ncbi:MAG: TetR/AcrR family transcriptional regulator [Spirochaetaceae bacterium]|jgi:AcrR family transcriptional regulator|nr:TetR/AcrR family transcriptional regulator [Spirochaetaceae bacterium]
MTKSEIIQAAFETWGAGRYQTTSLAELAGALGVSKTALYHHFRNKEDILGAMRETFIDRLADSLRPLFENTLVRLNQDAGKPESLEAILCINSGMTEFFAENPWYFMFSLIKLHGNTDVGLNIADHLREQGLDFEKFLRFTDNIDGKTAYPPIYQLVFTYSLCIISNFLKDLWEKGHLKAGFRESPPPGVPEIIQKVNDVVRRGLGFRREKIDSLDWKTLEAAAEWRETGGGGGGLGATGGGGGLSASGLSRR